MGSDTFTWTVGPVISNLSPNSVTEGSGSYLLTIIGAEFQAGATTVTLSGPSASAVLTPNVFSSSSMTVTVPASLQFQTSLNVTVAVPDGSGITGHIAASFAVPLTVNPPPSLVFIYPNQVNFQGASITGLSPTLVTPTGDPNVTNWNITGLPPGLGFNASGVISGAISTVNGVAGVYTVTASANDDGTQGTDTFSWTINPPNVAPSFTPGGNEIASIDDGPDAVPYSYPSWAQNIVPGPASEYNQSVHFTVTNSNSDLFTAGGQPTITLNGSASYPVNGTLSFTTAPFANGADTVTVTLMDNAGTQGGGQDTSALTRLSSSSRRSTRRQASPAAAARRPRSTMARSPCRTPSRPGRRTYCRGRTGRTSWTSRSASRLPTAIRRYSPKSRRSRSTVSCRITPLTGTLSYTTAPFANGTDTVTVKAVNSGGAANGGSNTSAPYVFVINVAPVNQAPSFSMPASFTDNSDHGSSEGSSGDVPNWVTNVVPGPSDESGQSVSFTVTNNNQSLFLSQPTITFNGASPPYPLNAALLYQTKPLANGDATVSVTAVDNGGTANGGQHMSAMQTFVLHIRPVNVAPSFSAGQPQQNLVESAAPQPESMTSWASAISIGGTTALEGGQSVHFTVTNSAPTLFSVQPAVSSTGTLTYTAAPQQFGTATVTVTAVDDGGTANGGQNMSAPANFLINVARVNQPPTFTPGPSQSPDSDDGPLALAYVISNLPATNISPGPNQADESINFTVTNNNGALFTVQPSVLPNGTLTYTTAPGALGSATVMVTLHNSGSTANGGVTASTPASFIITVTPTDQPATVAFANLDTQVFKTSGYAVVEVNLSGSITAPVSVNYATSNGPAIAGTDYVSTSGTLNFPVGVTTESFTVQVLNDGVQTGSLRIQLTLSDPVNAVLGAQSQAVVTIQDTFPTDNDEFISGLYHDFLGRPADSAGLSYFLNPLLSAQTPQLPGVIARFVNSIGYDETLVGDPTNGYYAHYLGRPATTAEAAYWGNAILQGQTNEQVISQIVSSQEYYNGKGGGNLLSWLQSAYQDILGRPLDFAGQAFFLPQLGSTNVYNATTAAALQHKRCLPDSVLRRVPDRSGR